MQRLLLTLSLLLLPISVSAQTDVLVIPSISNLGAVVIPASAVNGSGKMTCPQGIATTSTDCLVLPNNTAATAGATVQMSPRLRFRGTAWDTAASQTVDFFIEALPATAATPTGQLKFGYSLNGAAATYPVIFSDAGRITATAATFGSSGTIVFGARSVFRSDADKLTAVIDAGQTTGLEINVGTPTLGTCTAGAITSGSHNFAGEITGNTSGSCIVNFGTPNFTNTPICFAMSRTSTTHPRISAASASSITITGGVSGEAIGYHCDGRIGI